MNGNLSSSLTILSIASPSFQAHMVGSGGYTVNDDSDLDSVVDFKGNTVDKHKTGGWLAAGLILGTELAERVCVMGIMMNLVTYLTGDLHLPTPKAANIVTNFVGTLNLLPLFSGFLADAKLGRYMTVAIFGTITASGMSLLTVATTISSMRPPTCNHSQPFYHGCIPASGRQLVLLFVALYTIAIGASGIKACVSAFGSDQFDTQDPKEEKGMIFFFSRFFFGICIGSLFSVTVLVYIQDNVGRGWGYGISAVAMIFALIVLLVGTQYYRYRRPRGSPLTVIWRVLRFAWKNRKLHYPRHPNNLNEYSAAKVPHTERFRCLDKAAIIASNPNNNEVNERTEITDIKMASTVTEVEEVKMVLKLLPIWSTCILFWTVYSQMTTFSVEQASYTNRNIVGSFVYPSGSLSVFLFLSIFLVTTINEKILVPFARRFTGNVQGITSLQRIAVGLVFSILAMVVAGVVEQKRRDVANASDHQKLRVFYLLPQYILVGAGEAFVYVGELEFFIRESPERMKSMSTGLFFSTIGVGFYVSSFLVSLVNKVTNGGWLMSDLNRGRLDYFYWMISMLQAVNLGVFVIVARGHEYKVRNYNPKDQVVEVNEEGCK